MSRPCGGKYFLFTLMIWLAATAKTRADDGMATEDSFRKGSFETSVAGGCLFSPFLATQGRPTVNYSLNEFRLGYMLTDVAGPGMWRGNVEVGIEAFGGPILQGRGTYIAGGGFFGRYNFVPADSRFVPYAQFGLGLVSTDVHRRLVGQNFNFNVEGGIGCRYALSSHWSVSLEYRYQHVSNAGLAARNLGINAHGPMLGVSYFF